jgi:hypothetical protein
MQLSLQDFLGRHEGQTAYLFGKGPSLDAFDMAKAGAIRCAVNDVIGHVPGCVYGFANDSVEAWKHLYQEHQVLFHPNRTNSDWFTGGSLPSCRVCLFDDDHDDNRLFLSREALAEFGLAIRSGTIGSAIQIFHIMGIKRVVCVGIDGGQRWAQRQFLTRLRNEHYKDYNRIRDHFIQAAEILGIKLEFFGGSGFITKEGKMRIRIINDTIGDNGDTLRAGKVVDQTQGTANRLVALRMAEPFMDTRQPQVEVATVDPAAETADVKPRATPRKAARSKK